MRLYNNETKCRTCTQVGAVEDEDHLLNFDALRSENLDQEVKFDFVYEDLMQQWIPWNFFVAAVLSHTFI